MMMFCNPEGHVYSLASVGLGNNVSELFASREAAEQKMYSIVGKRGLVIREIWDDRHDKTYNCDNGVSFYIQRANC